MSRFPLFGLVIFFLNISIHANDEVIKITYWPSSNPQEIGLATDIVDKWNKIHPEIQVIMQPLPSGQSSEEVLLTAVAAKTTPDVCSNIWPGIVEEFAEANAIIALDKFNDFYEIVNPRIPDDVLKNFASNDGHYYQMPWKGNPIMMEYNVRLFREAGVIEPPRTYEEFMEAAEKLTRDTDGDGVVDQWAGVINVNPVWWHRFFDFYAMYIAASGGRMLFKEGEVDFDNEYAVAVFRFLQEGFKKGYFPKGMLQGNQFLLENIAIQFAGPWDIGFLKIHAPPDFEYDYAPLPVPEGTEEPILTYSDPKNIVIFSTSKHPEEAWEFVKFLISKKSDLKLLEFTSQIPFRKDLDTDPVYEEYFKGNPLVLKFAKQIPFTRGSDNITQLKEVFDVIAQSFEYSVIYDMQDPKISIKEAAETCRRILRR